MEKNRLGPFERAQQAKKLQSLMNQQPTQFIPAQEEKTILKEKKDTSNSEESCG